MSRAVYTRSTYDIRRILMESKDAGVLEELLQIKREIASEYKTFHDYFVDLLKYQEATSFLN